MGKTLPFFNWSLKKALDTEPDSFVRARIRIIYTILLFSLLKASIVIGFGLANEQRLQVVRAAVAFVLYITLGKVLLSRPARLQVLSHIMILAGLLIVWTNIFVFAHKINLVTIQFVFMVAMSSFYILGSRLGFIYSFIAALPVTILLFLQGNANMYVTSDAQELASPGNEIIVVLNFVTMVVAHYLFYNAFHANIREKEELNRQLQVSIEEAHKLAESRSNFLSTMSHELRTPLNSVIGITELLIQDKPEERQKENLQILQFSTMDLHALINNILDFNKAESDKVTLEAVPFRLAEFVRNICAGLRLKAADKNLAFVMEIDAQLERMTIVSDPTRLSQLMYNLISNAIKFTEKGSVTVRLECIAKGQENVEVMFSVTDTGIGIHPDRHGTIFELFTQAESHITRKYGGTGLGLAIVKQILGLFNSVIQLQSSPGNGTRFYFAIPFVTSPDAAAKPATYDADKMDLSHLKILIAEDNDVNRLLLKKQFGKLKLEPVIVENGEDAYEAFLSAHYDAIFMDLHMPLQDGYETTSLIRGLADTGKAGVYIIAFTASVMEQQKIMETGFNDFLYKPVNMTDLRDKLETIAAFASVE